MNRKLSLVSAAIVSVGLSLSDPANAVTMNYIGQWASATTYSAGSVVYSGNQTFYALNASKGQNPLTAASYWKLIGTNGNTVANGTAAPTSAIGNVGDFYIETTNKRLYGPKTATGWPTTFTPLIGPTGPQGPIGATGPKGATGATGSQGPAGPQGATGPAGPQGPMGVAGPAGPQGTAGAAGAAGKTVLNGTVAPISTIGNVGDFYIETTNKRLYGPKTATGWPTTFTALIGPTGPQGPIGLTGPVGAKGATGATGPQGPIGATGPKGATGATGPQGPAGTMPAGTAIGDIQYWDGSAWKLLPKGADSAILTVCNGVPTWTTSGCNVKPVARWSFDDCTALDVSGNGYNGTMTAPLTCIDGVHGTKGLQLKKDGYIVTGYRQNSVTAYSVSVWFNISANEMGGVIVQNRGGGGSFADGLSLWAANSNAGQFIQGQVSFILDSDGVALGKLQRKLYNDGLWHHLVGTWAAPSGTTADPSQFSIFVDGVRISAESQYTAYTPQISPLSGAGNLIIGWHGAWDPLAYFYEGKLDDVRIYEKELTEAEVQAIYTNKN